MNIELYEQALLFAAAAARLSALMRCAGIIISISAAQLNNTQFDFSQRQASAE